MFKNVANLVKFKNQLLDEKARAKRAAKKEAKRQAKSTAEGAEPEANATESKPQLNGPDEASRSVVEVLKSSKPEENFFVRESRNRMTNIADRLRRVKTLSAIKLRKSKADEANSVWSKPKFVIDYDERNLNGHPYALSPDEDEDLAYETASEGLQDDEGDDEAEQELQRCRKPDEPYVVKPLDLSADDRPWSRASRRSDAADEKVALPEELCDIPTFLHTNSCEREVIDETRRILAGYYAKAPEYFYEEDYERMLKDDWTVTRFLLRRRKDPTRTAMLMENCGKFRKYYKMGRIQSWEFPAEFHFAGGLFQYAQDRAGNTTMYMRVRMYRRIGDILDVFRMFLLRILEDCDVSTGGRGTAVVFDLTGAGIMNADLAFLLWLLNSFRNYCPKGVCYIMVLNLPWFLSATAKMAMSWMSITNRRALRFVQGKEIENFIAPENLPDYLGGTCQQDYRRVPEGCLTAAEMSQNKPTPNLEITPRQAQKIKSHFKSFLPGNYEEILVAQRQSWNQNSIEHQRRTTRGEPRVKFAEFAN